MIRTPTLWRLVLTVLALAVPLAAPARAETLHPTGRLVDERGQPRGGQAFRLVAGSDPAPRAAGAGRLVRTDAEGRFPLTLPVTLRPRRITLDTAWQRHDSRLMELGFGIELLGRPAL